MSTFWFVLAAIFVAVYSFNTGVATTPAVKSTVNIVAILLTAALAISQLI